MNILFLSVAVKREKSKIQSESTQMNIVNVYERVLSWLWLCSKRKVDKRTVTKTSGRTPYTRTQIDER